MNHLLRVAKVMLLCGVLSIAAQAGTLDPHLAAVLEKAGDQEVFSVLVYMADRVDIDDLNTDLRAAKVNRTTRHETVVTTLKQRAAASQAAFMGCLVSLQADDSIESFQSLWIANCVRVDAKAYAIKELALRDDVYQVFPNYPIESIDPTPNPTSSYEDGGKPAPFESGGVRAAELGVQAVRAPEVWNLGFTGAGVVVATLDTGVDGNHPALASRWRGVADARYAGHPEWAFYDPYTGWTFPQDSGSHGTHTMGSVCGGAPGNETGVAPGAQWIHAAVVDRNTLEQTCSDAILAYQWLIDPDGDPATSWDVPHVCSNSWGIGTWHNVPPYNTPCDDSFWSYLDACEAAGIVIVFSAGNEGSSPNSLRRPSDRATDEYRTFSVGGINANSPPNWFMYTSSSRGPSYCTPTGDETIKPDIAAPAEDVISCLPGGSYGSKSGTSMASPHVNGVVALILEACPDLSVEDVKQIIYDTALDLGAVGKDNDYGYGLIDAYDAVNLALAMCSGAPRARDGQHQTPVNTTLAVELEANDYDGLPDPPGMLTYIITSLPSEGNTLTDPGNEHVILAEDLPYTLIDNGNLVEYTPTDDYYGTDTFEFKANDGGVPPDAGDSNVAIVSVLVLYDPPEITTETLPSGLINGYYGPVQLEADQGQPELNWIVLTAGEYFETELGSSLFEEVGTARDWHDDDGAWSYNLPFSFPFYGDEYSTAYVCTNGFINFGSQSTTWDNTDTGLISEARIAPLWDDLRTDTGDSDIYIYDSIPGQVTIRWDAVTYTGSYSCNFSITLYEDGLIRFHYGSGNTGLTPTIGISAGNGTNYLLASNNNASSLTNANSLEFMRPAQLPEGLELSTEGVLTGVPTELGIFNPTVRVTDSLGRSDQRDLVLEINSGPVPPVAEGQSVVTAVNTSATIDLVANDDGLPDPPSMIEYVIASLPAHGFLTDPGAGYISSVPYVLADNGAQVIYKPDAWQIGADSFTFVADDYGVPPEGGESNAALVEIEITPPDPASIYFYDFNEDPGWTVEGLWAHGAPAGLGSHTRDPHSGFTGDNVYGYNLAGDYELEMPVYNLTTTAIDCSNLTGVELRFWKWLGVERWDGAGVLISSDGVEWETLWDNDGATVSDYQWSQMAFDISAIADREPTVFLRWFMGPSDDTVTYPGWNIDDVEIIGVMSPLCAGDFNNDGYINLSDLASLLSHYGDSDASYADGDMDGDSDVDLSDLSALLSLYGTGC